MALRRSKEKQRARNLSDLARMNDQRQQDRINAALSRVGVKRAGDGLAIGINNPAADSNPTALSRVLRNASPQAPLSEGFGDAPQGNFAGSPSFFDLVVRPAFQQQCVNRAANPAGPMPTNQPLGERSQFGGILEQLRLRRQKNNPNPFV